jgi:hypothetical protein
MPPRAVAGDNPPFPFPFGSNVDGPVNEEVQAKLRELPMDHFSASSSEKLTSGFLVRRRVRISLGKYPSYPTSNQNSRI